jgi:hypothetical protein
MKGTKDELPEIVCSHAIDVTEDSVIQAHKRYWERQSSKSDSRGVSIIDEVNTWAETLVNPSREAIARKVCDVIVSRKKPLSLFYVKMVVNSVEYRNNSSFREQFISDVVNKL